MMPFPGSQTSSTKSVGRSEYGRVKVELPVGKSLMDWIRLATGKILAKKRMSVDHVELVKHNKRDDCWIHISGQVYDVTSYLEFHPGGILELMRAAGTDATELFNQYHPWVNYGSMLKSCHVGSFTVPKPSPSITGQTQPISEQLNSLVVKAKDNGENFGISVVIDNNSLTLSHKNWIAPNLWLGNILADMSTNKKHFRIVIRPKGYSVMELKWSFCSNVSLTVYRITVKNASVIITFESIVKTILSTSKQSINKSPVLSYYVGVIEKKRYVSHDTVLFTLRLPEGLFFPVSAGRHVSIKVYKGASTFCRAYTPVSPGSLSVEAEEGNGCCDGSATVLFMIKIYNDGICTPSLGKLAVGDTIEISEPIGSNDLSKWTDPKYDLLLLAAGTGLTPMVNVLISRLRKIMKLSSVLCTTHLLLFNKTEQDIVSDDWLPIRWCDNIVKVDHILSAPSEKWSGRKGRISSEMIPAFKESLRILICGPDGFIENSVKLLDDAGYKHDNIYIFKE
ncbi:cytochrome b5-like Heme/Steroid binding domain protein [Dictyocaulus viviparus]|uniref:Cytochrome b5-like Heme/Steroid binding domain protein n=1 Tax=Dictyocaulus viviparus TaxID=29172 RepID=A0A0D8YAP4_DICVI|nr:cytochrome b5-like Heme/Steroid binding domain protein [Dictyocaulus viviparus]